MSFLCIWREAGDLPILLLGHLLMVESPGESWSGPSRSFPLTSVCFKKTLPHAQREINKVVHRQLVLKSKNLEKLKYQKINFSVFMHTINYHIAVKINYVYKYQHELISEINY